MLCWLKRAKMCLAQRLRGAPVVTIPSPHHRLRVCARAERNGRQRPSCSPLGGYPGSKMKGGRGPESQCLLQRHALHGLTSICQPCLLKFPPYPNSPTSWKHKPAREFWGHLTLRLYYSARLTCKQNEAPLVHTFKLWSTENLFPPCRITETYILYGPACP